MSIRSIEIPTNMEINIPICDPVDAYATKNTEKDSIKNLLHKVNKSPVDTNPCLHLFATNDRQIANNCS